MKATIEIPDELHRKVKAKSALEGRPIREVAVELFTRWVGESPDPVREVPFVSAHDLLKDICGIWDSGLGDLSTNPAYLEDLGKDSLGHR